jgi:hypothetical protein
MNGETSNKLAEALGALAIELQAQTGTPATLRVIVDAAVTIVPGTCWAGIDRSDSRRTRSATNRSG